MSKENTIRTNLVIGASAQEAQDAVKDLTNGINTLIKSTNTFESAFKNLKLPSKLRTDVDSIFSRLQKSISSYENELAKNDKSVTGLENVSKAASQVIKYFNDLIMVENDIKRVSLDTWTNIIPSSTTKLIKQATDSSKELSNALKEITEKQRRNADVIELNRKNQEDLNEQLKQFRDNETVKTYEALINKAKEYTRIIEELQAKQKAGTATDEDLKLLKSTKKDLKTTNNNLDSIGSEEIIQDFQKTSASVEDLNTALNELLMISKSLELEYATKLANGIRAINELFGENAHLIDEGSIKDITDLQQAIAQLKELFGSELQQNAIEFSNKLGQARSHLTQVSHESDTAKEKIKDLDTQLGQASALEQRITYFFSMANAIQLVRRAIRAAFQSVKELDEIMTETAVVTDFDVSDMWAQLPEYTARANALGVAIKDVYKASTLYYQQGLSTNEVMQVTNATLKMARIAGLDAAEATNKMTAALRGFNMVVNEANADRVSDVYSKLAAITASDVDEISTAMTKTASIASNAGMQFETTAAFLSQIIETTRESAETAGTALKTVIARFSELKKDPAEIGEVDGEVIDANKIETALRSVGVSLRDTQGQFRDLDQVFIELASRWDSLDRTTQRYIATIAAGSRQQSRFIAMMSNYSRTQELVTAAEHAAGAANQQYEKTLDSLQTALNRLKNAWDEFTMGLANDEIIKTVIGVLTTLITVVNKATGVFGSFFGSFAKFGVAAAAFKGGSLVVKAFRAITKEAKDTGKVINVTTRVWQSFGKAGKQIKTSFTDTGRALGILIKNIKNINSQKDILATTVDQIEALGAPLQLDARKAEVKSFAQEIERLSQVSYTGAEAKQFLISANKAGISTQQTAILMTNAEVMANYKNILAEQGEAEATKYLTVATAEKRKVTLADIVASAAQGAATKEVTAQLWAEWIAANAVKIALVGIIAVIGIVALGIAAAMKQMEQENELNNVAARLSDVKNRLSEISTAMDELADAQQSWNDINKELQNSVQGSAEWYSNLAKVNSQVFDLIEKYPFLKENGSYVIREEAGNYSITSAGWQAIAQHQQQEFENINIEQSYLLAKDAFARLIDDLTDKYIENNVFRQNDLQQPQLYQQGYQLYNKYRGQGYSRVDALNAISFSGKSIEQVSTESLKENVIAMFQNDSALLSTPELRNFAKDVLKQQGINDANMLEAYTTMLLNGNNFNKDTLKKKDSFKAWATNAGWDEAKINEYVNDWDNKKYDALLQQSVGELKANYQAMTGDLGEIYANFTDEEKRLVGGLSTAYLADLDDLDELEKKAATIEDETAKQNVLSMIELLRNAQENINQSLTKLGLDINGFAGTLANAQSLVGGLTRIKNTSGQGTAKAIGGQLSTLFNLAPDEETKAKIGAALSFDWSNLDNWEHLSEYIAAAGIEDEKLVQAILDFAPAAQKAAHAVRQIDLTTVNARLKTLGNTLENLFNGDSVYKWSKEAYDALIDTAPQLANDFRENFDGSFTYIAGDMASLIEKIEQAGNEWTKAVEYTEARATIAQFDIPKNGLSSANDLLNFLNSNGITDTILEAANIGVRKSEIRNLDEEDLNIVINKIIDIIEHRADYESQFQSYRQIQATRANQRALTTSAFYIQSEEDIARFEQTLQNNENIPKALRELFARGVNAAAKDIEKNKSLARAIANTINIENAKSAMNDLGSQISEYYEQLTSASTMESYLSSLQMILSLLNLQEDAWAADTTAIKDYSKMIEGLMVGDKGAVLQWLNYATGQSATDINQLREWINNDPTGRRWAQSQIASDSKLVSTRLVADTSGQIRDFYEFNDSFLTDYFKKSGGDKSWRTQYEWLYDMNEKINAQLKVRNRLEREYQRELDNNETSAQKLAEISRNQLSILEEQGTARAQEAAQAKKEIQQQLAAHKKFAKYVSIDYNTGRMAINYEAVNNKYGNDQEQGELFEQFIDRITELRDAMLESEEDLQDIYDEVKEIQKRGRDELRDLEISTRDAIVNHYTKQIDLFDSVSQAIEQTNSKLIESMQQDVAARRQARSNAETESDLTDRRRRLSYLQMDSSGANALEIQKLSEELAKAEQQYGDTLVDQALEQMRTDNERAAEQRQEQIQLMHDQLTYAQESGELWGPVANLLNEGLSNNGLVPNSQLEELLKSDAGWASLSALQKEDLHQELGTQGALAALFKEQLIGEDSEATLSSVKASLTSLYEGFSGTGGGGAKGWFDNALANSKLPKKDLFNAGDTSIYRMISQGFTDLTSALTYDVDWAGVLGPTGPTTFASGKLPSYYYQQGADLSLAKVAQSVLDQDSSVLSIKLANALYELDKRGYGLTHLATGGVADFTGPAWLDGTPSRPELVLNPDDSRNFLILRDALSSLTNGNVTASSTGDNYYDINIDATLANDYDTEQLGRKIKNMIVDDAMYRNVTAVNRLR